MEKASDLGFVLAIFVRFFHYPITAEPPISTWFIAPPQLRKQQAENPVFRLQSSRFGWQRFSELWLVLFEDHKVTPFDPAVYGCLKVYVHVSASSVAQGLVLDVHLTPDVETSH